MEAKRRVKLVEWASASLADSESTSWALLAHALSMHQRCCSGTAMTESDIELLQARLAVVKAESPSNVTMWEDIEVEDVQKFARPCISVELGERDDYSQVGRSRIGGLPDLPAGMKWPCSTEKPPESGGLVPHEYDVGGRSVAVAPLEDRPEGCEHLPMTFIAQINLEEAARAYAGEPSANPLPHRGMLYIFFGKEDYEAPETRVLFQPGAVDSSSLALSQPPFRCDFNGVVPPGGYAARHLNMRRGLVKIEGDHEYDDHTLFDERGFTSRMLGPATLAHTVFREGGWATSHARTQFDSAWQITLFRIPSWGGMQWCDMEVISVSLHACDLARRDFSKIVVEQNDFLPVRSEPWNA
jgi:uncharacterized protein YwqG